MHVHSSRRTPILILISVFVASRIFAAEIHDAASSGDTAKVIDLLKQTPALANAKDPNEDLPLHLAASKGWTEIMAALLDAGADVNAKGHNDWTPLHYAAKGGNIGGCRLLIQRGANREALNRDKKTPQQLASSFTAPVLRDFVPNPVGADELFKAIEARDAEKAKALIAAHPDALKGKDESGRTPLLFAAATGQAEVVRLMLASGAAVSVKDRHNVTALGWAARTDSVETTRALIEAGADVNAQDDAGFSPLATALERHLTAQVVALLEHGPKLELAIKDGRTPLLLAVGYGYADLVEILLKAGAKPTVMWVDGSNLLHRAANSGQRIREQAGFKKGEPADYAAIVKMLLDAGLPVDVPETRDGWTALHIAAMCSNVEGARLLLAKGAKVAATGKDGRTPLHMAAMQGTPEMIALLLDHGAPIDAVQANHPSKSTPLVLAEETNKVENLKLLLKRGANLQVKSFENRISLLHAAAWHNHVEIAKILLDAGIPVDVRDADRGTPLVVAVSRGSREAAQLLIEKGADVNARFVSGDTILKVATERGQTEVASLLKARGAKK
jgi:uncharacterized protein